MYKFTETIIIGPGVKILAYCHCSWTPFSIVNSATHSSSGDSELNPPYGVSMKEPQAYLSRVEVEVFVHLLQWELGQDPRLPPDNCKMTAPLFKFCIVTTYRYLWVLVQALANEPIAKIATWTTPFITDDASVFIACDVVESPSC